MSPVLQGYYDALTWTPVKSSNVEAYSYQPDFSYLWVRFKGGSVYLYEQVPASVASALGSAPSAGQFIYYTIRHKGKDDYYPYRRVV